jgi:hypothetical protein
MGKVPTGDLDPGEYFVGFDPGSPNGFTFVRKTMPRREHDFRPTVTVPPKDDFDGDLNTASPRIERGKSIDWSNVIVCKDPDCPMAIDHMPHSGYPSRYLWWKQTKEINRVNSSYWLSDETKKRLQLLLDEQRGTTPMSYRQMSLEAITAAKEAAMNELGKLAAIEAKRSAISDEIRDAEPATVLIINKSYGSGIVYVFAAVRANAQWYLTGTKPGEKVFSDEGLIAWCDDADSIEKVVSTEFVRSPKNMEQAMQTIDEGDSFGK